MAAQKAAKRDVTYNCNSIKIPLLMRKGPIVAKVEGAKDGYVARVTRIPGNVTRYVNRMLKKKHPLCMVCLCSNAGTASLQ